MKGTFAKRGLMSLVAGFFLFGFLLLSAGRAEAQTTNWVGVDEAKVRLEQAVKNQNVVLTANPQDMNALIHAYYYKEIYALINDGISVPEAVVNGLGSISARLDPNFPIDKTKMQSFKSLQDEATDLLSN